MKVFIISLLIVAILVAAYFYFSKPNCKNVVCDPNRPGIDTNGNASKCCGKLTYPNPNQNGSGNTNTNTTPPNVAHVPSISDYEGKYMTAPYDGIKVYYNYDLTEAKTFNKGETIGWLGAEETGNWICPNRTGFYKVNDSGATGNCDIIISDSNVKAIFGLK